MMKTAVRLRDHWLAAWLVLSLPALALTRGALQPTPEFGMLLHVSGEVSARLLVLTLMLTPLVRLTKWRWARWLAARRRWIGVASFGYAALHLAFYAVDSGVLTDVLAPEILTGWLAFWLFVPLTLTSTDRAVRRMGRNWKRLQRLTYVAAVFTLVHWVLLEYELGPALVHAAPVIVLRAAAWVRRRR